MPNVMNGSTYQLFSGDALEQLRMLPDSSVNTCITSPPYFGLRDYGVEGQIGLESTPAEYVAKLVAVFREVRRVLRSDGTFWLNLGDSYANDDTWGGTTGGKHATGYQGEPVGRNRRRTGLTPKDLMGIPWRVAFALQEDCWTLRSDIIWAKPNPMPESVTDRPTRSHEYVFLLSKSARYYYDAEAIKEEGTSHLHDKRYGPGAPGRARTEEPWNQNAPYKPHRGFKSLDTTHGRNKRDVWTVATHPYPEAHFATFPEELIEPMILAGCPEGGIVLDPFAGSGTTLAVANRLGRHAIGIELNPAYACLVHDRCVQRSFIFAEQEATPDADPA